MSDFHFLRPFLLLLWIPFVLLVLRALFKNRHATIWHEVCSKDLLPYVVSQNSKKNLLPYALVFLTGTLLITALAGPSWQMIVQPVTKVQSGLVIALDLSPAMDSEDIKPSRLQRAIYKINDLLTTRKEGQTALLVYSKDPYVVTPLTDDVETIKAMLPVLESKIMPTAGNRASLAIKKACELLDQGGIKDGSILLVTSQLSPQELEKSIEFAKQKGARVSVLGVGSTEGVPIPDAQGGFLKDQKGALVITKLAQENLTKLASLTNGRYAPLCLDDTDLHDLARGFTVPDSSLSEELGDNKQEQWHDQGYLFVLAVLPFISFFFRKGMLLLLLFFMPCGLSAGSFWKTQDQEGQELFQQEQFQEARDSFQNLDWKGAASYKLGEYDAAAECFSENQSVEGYYNFGTARAKQGDFEGALAAYAKALELDPEHEDTLYNKKIIEEQEKQNQDKQKQDKQGQDKQKQDKQEQKQQDQGQQDQQQKDQDQDQEKKETEKNNRDDQDNQDPNQKEHKQQDQRKDKESEKAPPADQKDSDEEKDKEAEKDFRDQMNEKLEQQGEPKELKAAEEESPEKDPQQQGDERWLQKVKDDPGGLLRRKFQYQYQQQQQQSATR